MEYTTQLLLSLSPFIICWSSDDGNFSHLLFLEIQSLMLADMALCWPTPLLPYQTEMASQQGPNMLPHMGGRFNI